MDFVTKENIGEGGSNYDDKYVEKVFNWSEVHFSEMTCYKIHTFKYCRLRPLKTKQATEIAHNLMDFFCDLGAPLLLHSDNGR